ncbi:MAG: 5'-nucleotidase, partial [Deltaproteobacteria bacterium]
DRLANLDTLIGFSPTGVSRTNDNGGDSPMGNLVTTAMQRRLGIQTDFSLTNTLGIRDSIPLGPVSVDQIFNVFPFDNSITTVQLSGREVRELFDFVARRSGGRGCNSQAQISGARVVVQCSACERDGLTGNDVDTTGAALTGCARTVNIGQRRDALACLADADCLYPSVSCSTAAECPTNSNGVHLPCNAGTCVVAPESVSLCDPQGHTCMSPLLLNGSYSLAANDYIAAGGSGFFVLQRNTTQVNTGVQLRDALVDYVQNGVPCGYNPVVAADYQRAHPGQAHHGDDGLVGCRIRDDCAVAGTGYVCSCPGRDVYDPTMRTCTSGTCGEGEGRCVLEQCVTGVAAQVAARCPTVAPPGDPGAIDRCICSAAGRAGETCRLLACFDESVGAVADGRLHMETVQ